MSEIPKYKTTMTLGGFNFMTLFFNAERHCPELATGISLSEIQSVDSMRSEHFYPKTTINVTANVSLAAAENQSKNRQPLAYACMALCTFDGHDFFMMTDVVFSDDNGFIEPCGIFVQLDNIYCSSTVDTLSPESRCRMIHGDVEEGNYDLIGSRLYLMMPGSKLMFRFTDSAYNHMLEFDAKGQPNLRVVLGEERVKMLASIYA